MRETDAMSVAINMYNDGYKKGIVEGVEEYKKALKTVLEEEGCIHNIDLDIKASKVIDGF